MLPSTSSSFELPQNILANIQYYPRRLLSETPLYHLKPTTPPAPPPNDLLLDHSSARGDFNANLIMVVTVLLCALICSLCISCIIRCVIKCTSLINQEPNYNINTTSHEVIITKSGIDKRALRTFPIVKYSKEVKIQGLDTDCVICLSEFKGGEKLRILPKCNHGFHVKCIDKWLNSHSSCPTCRQSLVDTCQKIIGSDDHQTGEMVTISIVRLEREDLVRNYRGQVSQT